jgi:hypothetical protein
VSGVIPERKIVSVHRTRTWVKAFARQKKGRPLSEGATDFPTALPDSRERLEGASVIELMRGRDEVVVFWPIFSRASSSVSNNS